MSTRKSLNELCGTKINRLTLVSILAEKAQTGVGVRGRFLCECGTYKDVIICRWRSGATKSCGCYAAEVKRRGKGAGGHCREPLYTLWYRIQGRGPLCKKWKDWKVFAADVGKIVKGKRFVRLDTNLPYSPENSVWLSTSHHAALRIHQKLEKSRARKASEACTPNDRELVTAAETTQESELQQTS